MSLDITPSRKGERGYHYNRTYVLLSRGFCQKQLYFFSVCLTFWRDILAIIYFVEGDISNDYQNKILYRHFRLGLPQGVACEIPTAIGMEEGGKAISPNINPILIFGGQVTVFSFDVGCFIFRYEFLSLSITRFEGFHK